MATIEYEVDTNYVLDRLRRLTEEAGSMRAWAEANGVSPQYVGDILKRNRKISENMAAVIGFRRVDKWEQIK
jgi:hypothetical protein